MKILFSGIGIVAGSGKLNGSVIAKNRGGTYARVKVTPTNPQTTAQQNARNILATWSQGWRGITASQRQGWINASPSFPYTDQFGFSRQLSGQQLYVKLNANLNYAGAAGIDDAPTPVEIPAITALSFTAVHSTGVVSIVFAPTPVPTGFSLLIYATPNIPASRSFVKNKFRLVKEINAAATSPQVITTQYAAIFGVPLTGQRIFIRANLVSTVTGQAGIPIQAVATVS